MAMTCSSSSSSARLIVYSPSPIKKLRSQILMLNNGQNPAKNRAPMLQIRSSLANKVFEDVSRGIVCHRDDNGEIICEGYDEGPRIHLHLPNTSYHSRDADIVDLLQQNLLQIVRGAEFNDRANKDDTNWNGFNSSLY